ncbi:MAG: FAD:protein FMN transferase [Deltaproteobacteria bacterium]|nr:FAD:protein FMN transferase [Deltaproteobacteria bacterium]
MSFSARCFFSILLVSTLFCSSASSNIDTRREFTRREVMLLDGVASITIIEDEHHRDLAESWIARGFEIITWYDQTFGENENSLARQINALPAGGKLPLPLPIFKGFQQALKLSVLTNGWFDLAAPSPKKLFKERDYRRIVLDESDHSISFKSDRMSLDLTMFARALAVDTIAQEFKKLGVNNAQIVVGGVGMFLGQNIHTPWQIAAVADTDQTQAHRAFFYDVTGVAVVELEDRLVNGQWIDPKDKKTFSMQFKRATVVSQHALTAVAFAVAISPFDALTAIRYLEKHHAAQGMVVDHLGEIFLTEQFRNAQMKTETPSSSYKDLGPKELQLKRREESLEK